MRKSIAAIFVLLLAGCSGGGVMAEAECLTADWQAIGYEDGAKGYGPDQLGPRREACAEYGVAPDFEAYMNGRERGLAWYCRPQNGFETGNRGYRYSGVCPAHLEGDFVAAHADGFGLYQRRVAMQNAARRLDNSRNRSQELEFVLADRATDLVSPGLSAADRTALAIEIKNLTREKVELEQAIPQLEAEYASARQEYDAWLDRISGRLSS